MQIVLADTHGPVLGKHQGTPNLGLLYAAASLREAIPGIGIRYIPQRFPAEEHFRAIESLDPDLYGISFTSYGLEVAYALMREIKRRYPKVLIVAGGPHVTAVPEHVLRNAMPDLCVIGEGERTLCEIASKLAELPDARSEIEGIAWLDDDGKLKRTRDRSMIEDIDHIPLPARDLVVDADYVGLSHRRATPNAEMVVTRGCPYRCVFCANPVFRLKGPAYRARSPESIAEEAELLYQRGYRELYLHSDELNVTLDWSIEVCKALASLDHDDLFFQCNMRVWPMNQELATWLRRANFWMVRFGIESASTRVLRGTKKKMARKQTLEACRLATDAGIRVWGYFLLYQFWEEKGELAWETTEEVEETIVFARELWKQGLLDYSSWMYAIPVQGAELFEIAQRHQMIDEDYVPSEAWDPSQHLPGVTRRDFRRAFGRARRLQARMALKAGAFELSNWRSLLTKARTMLPGVLTLRAGTDRPVR